MALPTLILRFLQRVHRLVLGIPGISVQKPLIYADLDMSCSSGAGEQKE